ncbi:nuclease-related domain-containing protein [Neobacillus terrae]|uniref:nuclease-related domain-containing protein n=1 Tax=Neobacillus terrae TaxID=3034837 RepID=UPI001408A758|nr:nuclease-related domain-containing protein [Neobacillus terrae]NHM29974.1 NERD domain-containing protein [Neobacillus terrae]
MYANRRSKPHKLLVLEILKNGRLSPNHSKMPIIEEALFKRTAGYNGEVAVDYYLKFLPQKENTIFYGLRLPYEDTYFQIDTLLLSKKFALILEIKNISGTLYFDQKSEQMIRIGSDGNEQGFEDPLSQAKRQQRLLKLFIKQNGLPDLLIEYCVVISRPSTILKPLGSPIFHKVCHAHSLNLKIEQIEKSHQKEILENKTIQKASRLLLKKHEPASDVKSKNSINLKNQIY